MASRKNTGTPFEKELQDIYQKIIALDGHDIENVRVERRAKIDSKSVQKRGKPLKHEIDLYWEFRASGITHKVCLQAKDDEVTLAMVLTFKGVLDDIAGQPRGIMVTSKHFQEGAFETARMHGIELYQLRPPGENDGITTIHITLLPVAVETRSLKFEYGQLPEFDENMQLQVGQFFDEHGTPCMTVPDLHKTCTPKGEDWQGLRSVEHFFEEPTYIHTGDHRFPRIQVKKATFEFELVKLPERQIVLSVDQVLESLTGAQSYFRDNKGSVRPKPDHTPGAGEV